MGSQLPQIYRRYNMKKMLLLALMAITSFGFSFTDIGAQETAYVDGMMGENLEVCINGYESFGYNIYAGQSIFAGTVQVYVNENGNIEFYVDLVEGAVAKEIHIYMYDTVGDLPTSRPAPGLAPYVWENIYMNMFTYEIPMNSLVDFEDYYFVFHLALMDDNDAGTPVSGVDGETAYVGEVVPGTGAWFFAMGFELIPCEIVDPPEEPELENETAYAFFGNDSIPFDERGRPWGWYAEYMEGVFPVYAGAARNNINKGTLVGYVEVDGLDVTFTPMEGYEAIGFHYYIGMYEPMRVPGRWQTITTDLNYALWMTFHFDIVGDFE